MKFPGRTSAAQALVDAVHKVCSNYRATRGNIEITLKVITSQLTGAIH